MNEDRLSALHRMTEDGFPITINDQVTRWKAGQQQLLEKQNSMSQGANASNEEENGINRMGLGLPLSNTYARYFGGSLDLMSLDGWGELHAFPFLITRLMDAMELYLSLLTILFQALMCIYDFRVSGQTSRTSKFECFFPTSAL